MSLSLFLLEVIMSPASEQPALSLHLSRKSLHTREIFFFFFFFTKLDFVFTQLRNSLQSLDGPALARTRLATPLAATGVTR